MARSEYDANAGLKEGRRINPGPAKLPAQVYISLSDVLIVMGAFVVALTVMANAEKIAEGLWKLWSVVTGVA